MVTKHFFNYSEIHTIGEYAVRRKDGTCYPEMGSKRIYQFSNGYGASVIRHERSYGGRAGLFELAVLNNGELCYTSAVASYIDGWLTHEQVDELLDKISLLP